MSVAIVRTTGRDQGASLQLHAMAMWRAQPGALMLLGRTMTPLPKAGSARMAALPGLFRAEVWPLGGDAGYGFLAAIRCSQAADRGDGAELLMRGSRGADREFRLTVSGSSDPAEFGKRVGGLAGPHAARLAHFMLDVMRSDEGGDMSQPRVVLGAFLAHAARVEGCVELIMHVPQRCVLLQGWGIPLCDPVEVLLPEASTQRHSATSGDFRRTDLVAPATGSVLALPPAAVTSLIGLETLYLLAGDELLCRRVVEPRVLDPDASIGQIRHLLPRLNCAPSMQELLRTTLQPQFDGHDTLNSAGRPVRAAVDTAVVAGDGAAYVSGWVYDPADHMVELHLCASSEAARLDESWVRVPRPDVSAAFAADPAFPAPLSQQWGFAVTTPPAQRSDQTAYLRFTFADGDLAFVPVRFSRPDSRAVLTSLVASVDLHKPSGLRIVERHLAPFVARLPPPNGAPSQVVLHGPLNRARSLVVSLRAPSLPRSLVSSFLLDPATSDEQVMFVCGPEWGHTQLDALVALIRFYALPASVIAVSHVPHPAHAVCEAAAVCQAETFLLASPGVVGNMAGWRDAIHCAAGDDPVVCPTVLFEDRSVRFAGPKRIVFLESAPFTSVHAPLAGACADFAGEGTPIRTDNGTLACCLIRRTALPALRRATRFMTEAGQEAAFFFALQEIGLHATWVPSIRVSAPEEDPALDTPASSLIDSWILRRSWGQAALCAS